MKPNKLKYGARTYDVLWGLIPAMISDGPACGLFSETTDEIYIDDVTLDEQMQRQVLLHEILHMIFYHKRAEVILAEGEEALVTFMAQELFEVCETNKEVREFIFGRVRKTNK